MKLEMFTVKFIGRRRYELPRGGSRAAAASKMELFVIIVNG